MDQLLRPYYNWFDLLLAGLILYGVYALLLLVRDRLGTTKRMEGFRATAYDIVAPFLLLYEPITLLVLLMIFVFISPVLHGALVLLVVVAGFARLRDYLSGRIVLFNPLVKLGKRMHTEHYKGVISRIGRFGLHLQTGEGLHFVNFSRLLTDGYSIITGKEIGGFYQLRITTSDTRPDELRELADRLTTVPYLDRNFKPELTYASREEQRIKARVSVREEQHLGELLALLEEWGYPANIAKK